MTDTAELSKLLAERDKRKRERLLEFYNPDPSAVYRVTPKLMEFHRLGKDNAEVALIAANRSGKTLAASAELAMHLTGLYPDWWPGRRFDCPIRAWSCGVTGLVVRDTNQKYLCGPPSVEAEQGTGFIPKARLLKMTNAHGYAGLYDTIHVKHVSGGTSTCMFKTYEQGRTKFQAEAVHVIHNDEEPQDDSIYGEELARIATTNGLIINTFTPLFGRTKIVNRFMKNDPPANDRAWIGMTIDDAIHFTPEQREKIIARYEPHEREARVKGVPMMGVGRIFTSSEESLSIDRGTTPPYWGYGIGIDFGITHPFAAVKCAYDRDNQVFYVLDAFKIKDARPIDHCARMKPWGPLRVFWPHDGSARDKGSGETLSKIYKDHGAWMYGTHASFPDGSISTEACISRMREAMTTGKFKVVRDLSEWWDEYRQYYRESTKDGGSEIVKMNDDLLSATMKAFMMRSHFEELPSDFTMFSRTRKEVRIAKDVDYNPFEIA